jgi:hypothetical protein
MSQTFEMTVGGSKEVAAALRQLEGKAFPSLRAALFQEANALVNDSKALCPVDTGNLINSAFTYEAGSVLTHHPEFLVGYGGAAAPYALAVHENPRAGKTGGVGPSGQHYKHWAQVGQWKYLETPFKARTAGFAIRVATFLKTQLLGG